MKHRFYLNALACLLALALAPLASAQDTTPDTELDPKKRGQTGMKFLTTSIDARATAIGGAMTAEMNGSSTSLFYNPASMAGMPGALHVSVGVLSFITDIDYNAASIAYRPGGGNYGVVGLSVLAVDYGEFIGTIRASNNEGFVETGTYSPTALAVGVGYARSFSDRFSAGAHIKYAYQNIGDDFATDQDLDGQSGTSFDPSLVSSTASYATGTVAFDFGVVYSTGFRSLVIAMNARNFAQEQIYERERFELPLTFQIGFAFNVMDLTSLDRELHSLMLHVDAQRPRDFAEHAKVGLEYGFMDLFFLRGGFQQLGVSEERGVSLGAGIHLDVQTVSIGVDYAYTDFGLFGTVNRFGLQIGL